MKPCRYDECYFQYVTPEGLPFYVNLPSSIIKRCLASIDIAKDLQRYPTLIEEDDLCW